MADDRALEEPPQQVGRIEQELADLKAMVNARLARRPTGDMEISFRATPKDGTLVCNGQAVSRTDYADLFNWATDQGLMGSLFGTGDGSTTFNVPDVRDRFLAASGGSLSHGSTGGAAQRTLTQNELPSHSHTVTVQQHAGHGHSLSVSGSTNSAGSHTHSGSTDSAGSHSGHNSGSRNVASALQGSQDFFFSVANTTQNSNGGHTHGMDLNSAGGHTHTVSVDGDVGQSAAMSHTATAGNAGNGQAFDQRPPWVAVSVLIWA